MTINNNNNNNAKNNIDSNSNEALADAFAGVIGTLVSLWCFYPIERIKTNIQAGKSLQQQQQQSSSGSMPLLSLLLSSSSSSGSLQQQLQIKEKIKIVLKIIKKSFRGCFTKSLHASSSSFCYFYFYSWIVSIYNNNNNNNKRRRRSNSNSNSNKNNATTTTPLRPSTRLILSTIAAMINTFVTLPLDVLSSKQTVNSNNNMFLKDKKEKEDDEVVDITTNNDAIMSKTWDSISIKAPSSSTTAATATTTYQQQQHQQSTASNSSSASASASSSSTVELVFHETCSRSEDIFSLNSQDNNGDDDEVEVETETENENEDDEDKHNLNTSNCSSSNNTSSSSNSNSNNSTVSSTSNEEYMIRWKQHELKQPSRCHQQPQKENRDIPLYNMKVTKNITSMTAKTTTTTIKIKTFTSAFIRRYSKLWKGLTPALLLCSNPSIHYTVYDVLKTKLLMSKQHSRSRSSSGSKGGGQQQQLSLSVSDAFILGLLSKFVATIVTYPLIRAKVLLMVEEVGSEDNNDSNLNSNLSSSSSSLWSVLKKSYYNDGDGDGDSGIKGLYKECNWQLIHTLLKSALMMTIREQITDRSRSLFDVKTKQTNKRK